MYAYLEHVVEVVGLVERLQMEGAVAVEAVGLRQTRAVVVQVVQARETRVLLV